MLSSAKDRLKDPGFWVSVVVVNLVVATVLVLVGAPGNRR
jgi:hypothetical protein